jgi:hypothetical protein
MRQRNILQTAAAKIVGALNLPLPAVTETCEVYLCGDSSLFISAHSVVLCTELDRVVFRCEKFVLTVLGQALTLDAVTATAAYVLGRILQVGFDTPRQEALI